MQRAAGMMLRALVAVSLATACMSCAHETTTSTTWVAEGNWQRPGTVESVREVVHRVEGQPVMGALAGALIGGILFHGHGPATLFGAATGAAIGAAASQGSAESRTFQILVHFDDGERGIFVFRDYAPFAPGARVVLSPQGLRASA